MKDRVRRMVMVEDPKVAITAMAIRKIGNTRKDSVIRIRKVSTIPRPYPAVRAIRVAIADAIRLGTTAISTATRAVPSRMIAR